MYKPKRKKLLVILTKLKQIVALLKKKKSRLKIFLSSPKFCLKNAKVLQWYLSTRVDVKVIADYSGVV